MSRPDKKYSSAQVLASILNQIGASDYFEVFIDEGVDDESLRTLGKFKPERISSSYGLSLHQAAAFGEMCRSPNVLTSRSGPPSSLDDVLPDAIAHVQQQSVASSSVTASLLDDATIIRMLHMEMIRELGKGGFGTVYEVKSLADRLKVALKIVKDPSHTIEAIREGQRLRLAKHKNIVLMHKVHDIGDGCCALEMEVVPGGDLFRHLEACRRLPIARLPHDAALRFSRQLLEALVYLHEELKWLHGDIKPQNILIQCTAVPDDASAVDYSSAEIKLADFGLTKILDRQGTMSSLMLSTKVGVLKGTMLYMSPEAIQSASSGTNYERAVSDDLWSACLVILEMDTGICIQQLMNGPGSVIIEELLTKASPELLPLLCAVLAVPSAASRCNSAAELLRILDASIDPLFVWQLFDSASLKYVSVHPASSVYLEKALSAHHPHTVLPLPPPFDLIFDIQALLSSSTALGYQTEKHTGKRCRIRRVLRASVLNSSESIPAWQELVDGKEWRQCSPAMCAKLDIDAKNPNAVIDATRFRHLAIESGFIGTLQLPHPMKSEPYLAPAHADDIAMLNRRVHDSLPEWDITVMQQVVNSSLASKYAAYRHRLAACCNGNPNERMMFHFAPPAVMPKIWQEGDGHDFRLSNWAEVGKGAYFSAHPMYGYAYKYSLWPSPPGFAVKPEPPIGETMQMFASLVCLGRVADMGPGCETCPSLAWDAWKKETPPSLPKPTRPPTMTLPVEAEERQHILDVMQVADAPRYDSVTSTEGDLGTHPASTNLDPSGRRICDIMHPRLRARAKEWAEQCVLFDTSASYPMYIVTLTKTRDSPMGPQQLIDAGCNFHVIKTLGFTASHFKNLDKTVREMLEYGWPVLDLKNAGFNLQSLLAGGCSAADLKASFFTALELKNHGCDVQQLKTAGYSPRELREASFDISLILKAGYSLFEMKTSGFTAFELKAAGHSAQELKLVGFSLDELKFAGFKFADLAQAQFEAHAMRIAGHTAAELQQAGYSAKQLCRGGFHAVDLINIGCDARCLIAAGYSIAQLRRAGITYEQLEGAGCHAEQLSEGGYCTCKNWKYFFRNPPGWVFCRHCSKDWCCCRCFSQSWRPCCGMKFVLLALSLATLTTSLVCGIRGECLEVVNIIGLAIFFGVLCLRTFLCFDIIFFILFKIPKFLIGRVVECCCNDHQDIC